MVFAMILIIFSKFGIFFQTKKMWPFDLFKSWLRTIRNFNKSFQTFITIGSELPLLVLTKGASINIIAKFLGHSRIEETLKTYSLLFISTLDEIINVIDTLEDKKTDD